LGLFALYTGLTSIKDRIETKKEEKKAGKAE
jgi:hypothetical protein